MKRNKLVYGVGINDADYAVKKFECWYEHDKRKNKQIWVCPFYEKWKNMLRRCYCSKYQETKPTYKGCSVCQEWLTFTNFKVWMEQQDYEGKQLDKDILLPGNKVYSPETCIFVEAKVNSFLVECNASRGQYMIGVSWFKPRQKFVSYCNDGSGKCKHLGYFNTELEAHKAWLKCKLEVAYQLAADQTDSRIAKALIERYENYKID